MRVSILAILAAGAVYAAAPVQAQTYDPNYPVCLQVYQSMVDYYFDCSYTSMAQCQASASGVTVSGLIAGMTAVSTAVAESLRMLSSPGKLNP